MKDSFAGVTCCNKKQISKLCINKDCRNSPFLCSDLMSCKCYEHHDEKCNIKGIDQLDENINTVLKFQFFMVYSP